MPKKPLDEPNGEPPLQSMLERHPDHVKAIGMISVEMANLEVMLAGLLGALLNLPQHIADAVYFSPQSTGARLAILENSVKVIHPEASLADVKKLLVKARKMQNKRNDHIHNAWGLSATTGEVTSSKLPIVGHGLPIALSDLNEQLQRLRNLITSVHNISPAVHERLWSSSPQKFSEPTRPPGSQPPASPKNLAMNPRPRARRKSSEK